MILGRINFKSARAHALCLGICSFPGWESLKRPPPFYNFPLPSLPNSVFSRSHKCSLACCYAPVKQQRMRVLTALGTNGCCGVRATCWKVELGLWYRGSSFWQSNSSSNVDTWVACVRPGHTPKISFWMSRVFKTRLCSGWGREGGESLPQAGRVKWSLKRARRDKVGHSRLLPLGSESQPSSSSLSASTFPALHVMFVDHFLNAGPLSYSLVALEYWSCPETTLDYESIRAQFCLIFYN